MSTLSANHVTIAAHGVLDHSRAETLAARLRAAVRNGKTAITLAFEQGTVMASPNLLAFLLRTDEALRARGGQLAVTGNQAILDELQVLGIPSAGNSPLASNQGIES